MKTYAQILKYIFLMSLILAPDAFAKESYSQESYDPTSDLLLAFGDRCPMSYGNLNRGALADSNALQKIIDSIKSDPNCNGVTGALSAVQSGIDQGAVLAPKQDELALIQQQQTCKSLQLAFNEVSGALADPTDPNYDYATSLQNALQNCKMSLLNSQSKQQYDKENLRLQTAQNLQNYTVQLFQQLNNSSKCVTKNPSIAAQVVGQVVGLASTLVNTTTGLGLMSASVLVDQLIGYVKNYKLGSALKKLSSASQITGVNCAMEAIAESYCQAKDKELAMKVDLSTTSKTSCQTLNEATVVSGNLNMLTQMINNLKNSGGNSQDSIDAQEEVNSGRASIQSQRLNLNSWKLSAQKKIPQEMEEFQKNMVDNLARSFSRMSSIGSIIPSSGATGRSSMGGIGNGDDGTCNLQVYFYSKGAQKEVPPGTLSNGKTCQDYLKGTYPNVPTVEMNIATANGLLDSLDGLLTAKASKIGGDSNKLITDILSSQPISGEQYLAKTHTYLENLKKEYDEKISTLNAKGKDASKSDLAFYQIQKEQAEKFDKSIVEAHDALYTDVSSDKKVENILKALTPNGDTQALAIGIQDLVAKDLQQRMKNKELNADVEELMKYSTSKTMGELTGSIAALAETPAASKAQIDDSKRLSTENLRAVSSVFGKLLGQGISSMKSHANADEDAETYHDNIAKSCILMAQMPDPPVEKGCKGTKWQDPGSEVVLDFDKMMEQNYETRVCTVHKFHQRASLMKKMRGAR